MTILRVRTHPRQFRLDSRIIVSTHPRQFRLDPRISVRTHPRQFRLDPRIIVRVRNHPRAVPIALGQVCPNTIKLTRTCLL